VDTFSRLIAITGSLRKLAVVASPDLSGQAVHHWRTRGIPAKHCPRIEQATGIRCEELRPDYEWKRDRKGRVIGKAKKT
jgi:DNA-binding transcriptional regulator YdaS (Cro superfamily)